jgi:hypothetical protein
MLFLGKYCTTFFYIPHIYKGGIDINFTKNTPHVYESTIRKCHLELAVRVL